MYEKTIKYTNNYWLSGFLSGLVVSPIVFTLDTFKIKRQINKPISLSLLKPMHGLWSTTARETLAMTVYFGTYKSLRKEEFILAAKASGLTMPQLIFKHILYYW